MDTSSVIPAYCLIPRPPSVVTVADDMCISKSGKSSETFAYFVLTKASPSTPPNDVSGPIIISFSNQIIDKQFIPNYYNLIFQINI